MPNDPWLFYKRRGLCCLINNLNSLLEQPVQLVLTHTKHVFTMPKYVIYRATGSAVGGGGGDDLAINTTLLRTT